MYQVAICDDKPADLQLISEYLTELEWQYPINFAVYHDSLKLINAYKSRPFDLVIFDMDKDCFNNAEVTSNLQKYNHKVQILMITPQAEPLNKDSSFGTVYYISTPLWKAPVSKTLQNIFDTAKQREQKHFTFSGNDGVTSIDTDDIFYFESDTRSIHVSSKQGKYTFTGQISSVEEQTAEYGFLRIHKSFVVNLSHIQNIYKESVTLDNGEILPLSHHRHKEVKDAFLMYLKKNSITI